MGLMLLLVLMAEEDWGGGGSGVPPAPSVQPPGLCPALPAASVVNGNLPLVSMAAGKINADKVTQEGEETLVASGLMFPLPHLTWPGGNFTHHLPRAPAHWCASSSGGRWEAPN